MKRERDSCEQRALRAIFHRSNSWMSTSQYLDQWLQNMKPLEMYRYFIHNMFLFGKTCWLLLHQTLTSMDDGLPSLMVLIFCSHGKHIGWLTFNSSFHEVLVSSPLMILMKKAHLTYIYMSSVLKKGQIGRLGGGRCLARV